MLLLHSRLRRFWRRRSRTQFLLLTLTLFFLQLALDVADEGPKVEAQESKEETEPGPILSIIAIAASILPSHPKVLPLLQFHSNYTHVNSEYTCPWAPHCARVLRLRASAHLGRGDRREMLNMFFLVWIEMLETHCLQTP